MNNAFLHLFGIFDDISKFRSVFAVLQFEKSSNMPENWQKMKKCLVQHALIPFFGWVRIPENPISGTRPVPTVCTMSLEY